MRAIAIDGYGPADLLTARELPDPPVGPDTVLVHGASGGVGHLAVQIARALGAGRLTVHVERTLPLAQAADAHRLVAAGHVRGTVVLEV
ncbi:zinc-binding dehydrogenase [Micromonospora deserti]|uniref:zinc-binding dehydrogenase n=1 Tax=Micromonospora deserti TaxID=2070366 RepID=UPI001F2DC572|nr:zinc-binding dehydrogenase [Micromonospora deserti]